MGRNVFGTLGIPTVTEGFSSGQISNCFPDDHWNRKINVAAVVVIGIEPMDAKGSTASQPRAGGGFSIEGKGDIETAVPPEAMSSCTKKVKSSVKNVVWRTFGFPVGNPTPLPGWHQIRRWAI